MKKIYSLLLLTALVCLPWSNLCADNLIVADGTDENQYLPIYGYYADTKDTRMQMIYPASALAAMSNGTINGLTFYANNAKTWGSAEFTVKLTEVENTTFSVTLNPATLQQVYSGSLSVNNENQLVITFANAYDYDGGNLLVDINVAKAGTCSGNGEVNFFGVNQETKTGICRGNATAFLPKVTFDYTAGSSCLKPTNLEKSATTPDGATFTWAKGGEESKHQWACVAAGAAVESWNDLTVDVLTKTLTGLTAGNSYDFHVRSYCGNEEGQQSKSVKINFTPVCPAPAYPENPVSASTDVSATIAWNAVDGISSYQYVYVAKNETPDWNDAVTTDEVSASLVGLTAYTEYDFYVRSYYSETAISEATKTTFRTKCGSETAPIKWTFEDQTANALPTCWDNSGSTSTTAAGGSSYYVWGVYSYGGNKSLRMNNYNTQTGTALINTPSIVIPSTPIYELAFDYIHQAGCGGFTVKVSNDGGDSWTDLNSFAYNGSNYDNSAPGEFKEATAISLVDYAGETIILQFFATADYGSGAIFVDNVEIRAKSNCPAPKSVLVSNVTANTASIAWTEKGEATAWKLQTSTDGENWTDVKDGEEVATITTNPYTLTGLEAETTYYVRVKADCGSETSEWSDASAAFTTKCEAKTIESFAEDFSGDGLPSCWEAASYGSGNGQWYVYSGEMRFNARVSSSTSVDLTTPAIVLTDVAELSFAHEGTSVTAEVYVNTGEGEVLLQSIPKTSATEKIDLSAYKNQTVSFTFRAYGYSAYSTVYFYLDDVKVDYAPVATPANLAAEAGNASATITWAAVEGAASYNFRYREYNAVPEANWTVENLTANTKSLTELTNGKTYEVQVQAVASANRKSDWTASATFTPVSCPTVTAVTFGAATYNSVVVNWTASAASTWALRYKTDGDWTVASSAIENQTYTLTGLTTNAVYTVEVKPTCSDAWVAAASTFTPAYTAPVVAVPQNITDAAADFSWICEAEGVTGYEYVVVKSGDTPDWTNAASTTENTAVLSGLEAKTNYVVYVRAIYPTGASEADDEPFTTITIAPKNLAASEITATSATLTWEYDGAATGFQWAVGNADNLSWNAISEKTITFNGLDANTSYTFFVRAAYGAEVVSDSIKLTFRTECEAIATTELPWSENFNEATALPSCWTTAGETSSISVAKGNSYLSMDSKAIMFSGLNGTYAYVILPEFEAALNTLQVSFSHKEEHATKSGKIEVGYYKDEAFTSLKAYDQSTTLKAEEAFVLTVVPAGARIAFAYKAISSSYTAALDDITVEKIPSCTKPVLGETTILPDGATFTWTAGHGEEHFQYAVDTTETLVWTATDALTATVHGLTPGNNYKFFVRAFCDPEASDSVFTAFVPVCPAPTALDVETAEQTTATFSWTVAEGISEYQYLVVERGETTDWTQAQKTVSTSAAWGGLEANTAYTFYVRSFYSEIAQSVAISVDFRTECAAVAKLSWSENFEGQTLNAAPACWEVVDESATGVYVSTGSQWFSLSDRALFFEGKTKNYAYALLPEFEAAWDTLQISFSHREESTSSSGQIEFGYYKDATFTQLKACDKTTTMTAVDPIKLTEVPADARLAFAYKTSSNTYAAAVDNILIEAIPACAVPTGLTASEITASGATIAWTSTAENFALELKQGEGEWLPVDATITNPFVLEGLQENTTYSVRVKAVCGEESESEFCDAIDFTTDCAVRTMDYKPSLATELPECWTFTGKSGGWKIANSTLRYEKNTGFAGAATLPVIHIEGNYPIIRAEYSNKSGQNVVAASVRVVADDVDSTYTLAEHSSIALMELDLAKFKGKDVTITINVASGSCYFDVETFQVINKPLYTPKNVAAEVGDGQATLTWEAGDNETAWDVYYYEWNGSAGEAIFSDELNVKTYTITGLTNGTTYRAHVRASYEIGGWSYGSEFIEFTPSKSTSVENTEAEKKAIKLIENNQLVIIHNGVRYNALGEKIQ